MNKVYINNINNLSEIQQLSYYNFLYFGIRKEISKFINPFLLNLKIFNKNKLFLIYLYPNFLKFKSYNKNINNCFIENKTYSIKIYILIEIQYQIKNQINTYQKYIYFTELPLITEDGTFIINGYEKVVINQIVKSPNIFFKKEFINKNKIIYTATIISNKGNLNKFILKDKEIYLSLFDIKKKNYIYFKLKNIISYFGITIKNFIDLLKNNILLISNFNLSLNNILINNEIFNNLNCLFKIGLIGRYNLNKKLNLFLPKNINYITIYDFIKIIENLIKLKKYNYIDENLDDLKNKHIKSIGNFLNKQLNIGLIRLKKNILINNNYYDFLKKKHLFNIIKNNYNVKYLIKNKKLILQKDYNIIFNEFIKNTLLLNKIKKLKYKIVKFTNNKNFILNNFIKKYLNIKNKIFDSRYITSSIKEFFNTSELVQFMDQTNPLSELFHKRKITIFGSKNVSKNQISLKLRDIHISQYGRICPIETPEGSNAGLISSLAIYTKINNLGLLETPYFIINNKNILKNKNIFYLNSFQETKLNIGFYDYNLNNKNNNKIFIKNNLSFLLENIKKTFFISILPIQKLSLSTSLIPFIEHNDASRSLMGSNMQRQALSIIYSQKPIVGTGLELNAALDSSFTIKSYSEGIVSYVSSNKIIIKTLKNNYITYYLKKYNNSNQKIAIIQKPIVWLGEKIFAGQIIAEGPSINDGELSLGQNLTVAYMPWDGYNYEDSIIINEKIILNNLFTSLHIHEIIINLYKDEFIYNYSNNKLLNKNGIIKIGSYIKPFDLIIEKIKLIKFNQEENYNIKNIFYNINKFKNYKILVPKKINGCVIDIKIIKNHNNNNLIKIYIAQLKKLEIGDKLSGRHGNKGIISKIVPNHDMPFLPNGNVVDILLNPLGVPSRMNIGQIFETILGLSGIFLQKRFKILPFDEIYNKNNSRILINQKLKEASIKTKNNWLFNSLFPGKILLKDGRTGEYFDNPITVGKSYILKLIHLVSDKIKSRFTGPYSRIFNQPTEGKFKNIGQRFGEMEVWTLESYGCSNILQEFLTIKSDDIYTKDYISKNIFLNFNIPNSSINDSFLVLLKELNSLGLDFSFLKFENNFSNTLKANFKEKNIFKLIEKDLQLK
jgi:DNA-directed RNA polymerase beta subunit